MKTLGIVPIIPIETASIVTITATLVSSLDNQSLHVQRVIDRTRFQIGDLDLGRSRSQLSCAGHRGQRADAEAADDPHGEAKG